MVRSSCQVASVHSFLSPDMINQNLMAGLLKIQLESEENHYTKEVVVFTYFG